MITIEVPASEVIDKVTILEIKRRRIADPDKLRHVENQLSALDGPRTALPAGPDLDILKAELLAVNETLWDVEDAIRDHERRTDFGPSFVALARAVYHNNDRRAALKARIDALTGSRLTEAKSYTRYTPECAAPSSDFDPDGEGPPPIVKSEAGQ